MLLPSSEAYRLWAPTYDSSPNPLLALEARLLSHYLNDVPRETVLEIACGTGRLMSQFLRDQNKIFGADNSFDMLAQACRKIGLRGKLVQGDVSRLPFKDSVADVTLCSFAVSYFPDLNAALSEIARVTKESGMVILSDLHPCATARGWTRSFRVDNVTFEIQCAAYSDHTFEAALNDSGLRRVTQINSAFSEQERSLFISAGKEHLFVEAGSTRAVRIGIFSKS